jgi:type IV pilus assembly protein PilC
MRKPGELIMTGVAIAMVIVLAVLIGGMIANSTSYIAPAIVMSIVVFVAAMAIYSIGTLLRARRHSVDLLSVLEQAVRLNLPLPQALDAFAESVGGSMARKVAGARVALSHGDPVAVVLETIPRFPRRLLPLLEVSERVGRLPQSLSRVVQQQREAAVRRARRPGIYRAYPLLVTLVTLVVVGMLMIFVMPKFRQIFLDFGVQLPPSLQTLLRVYYTWGGLLTLVAVGWLAAMISSYFMRHRGVALGLVDGPVDAMLNYLPVVGRVRMYRSLADALDFAADGIDAHRTAVDSIDEAATITTNVRLRERLMMWATALRSGESIPVAAQQANLPPMVWRFLAPAAESADLSAALRFLSRYYELRLARIMTWIDASLAPAAALIMGSVVGWVAVSIFSALSALVDAVLPYRVTL